MWYIYIYVERERECMCVLFMWYKQLSETLDKEAKKSPTIVLMLRGRQSYFSLLALVQLLINVRGW
jgi:hypothetical protein